MLYNKAWRLLWILEEIKIYEVKGKPLFNQMAAKSKNVEHTKAFIGAFNGIFTTQSDIWDGALC